MASPLSGMQPAVAAMLAKGQAAAAAASPAAQAQQAQQQGGGKQDQPKTDPPASNTGIIVFSAITGFLVIAAVIKMARSGK